MTFEEISIIKQTGIYKITNLISKYSYIGQAKNIGVRIKSHVHAAHCPAARDYNYPVHVAIRKYGIANFDFSILETCNLKLLNQQECYWIQKFDTYSKGYNQTNGGKQNIRYVKLAESDVIKIKGMLKSANYSNSEIAIKFKISTDLVSKINSGKSWYDPSVQYPIRSEAVVSWHKFNGTCVCQLNKATHELLNKFTSAHAAAIQLFQDDRKHAHIAECARGDRNSAWGFVWQLQPITQVEWKQLLLQELKK